MSEFKGTPGPWESKTIYGDLKVIQKGSYEKLAAGMVSYRCVTETENKHDACLIAAAPELLKSLTDGATVDLPELLDWVADRMVHVYGENENIDFVLTLRHRASVCREAIAKALGETK